MSSLFFLSLRVCTGQTRPPPLALHIHFIFSRLDFARKYISRLHSAAMDGNGPGLYLKVCLRTARFLSLSLRAEIGSSSSSNRMRKAALRVDSI